MNFNFFLLEINLLLFSKIRRLFLLKLFTKKMLTCEEIIQELDTKQPVGRFVLIIKTSQLHKLLIRQIVILVQIIVVEFKLIRVLKIQPWKGPIKLVTRVLIVTFWNACECVIVFFFGLVVDSRSNVIVVHFIYLVATVNDKFV